MNSNASLWNRQTTTIKNLNKSAAGTLARSDKNKRHLAWRRKWNGRSRFRTTCYRFLDVIHASKSAVWEKIRGQITFRFHGSPLKRFILLRESWPISWCSRVRRICVGRRERHTLLGVSLSITYSPPVIDEARSDVRNATGSRG
jgi:hypothetical protein